MGALFLFFILFLLIPLQYWFAICSKELKFIGYLWKFACEVNSSYWCLQFYIGWQILNLVFKHIAEFMHSKLAKFHLIIHLLLLSCLGGLFSLSLYLVFSHAFTCHPNFSYKADVKHLFVYLFCFF